MPASKFVCPHCEKPAEVQVTSVTRSRECPHCGKAVILQVGGKSKQGKRKALLVGSEPPAPEPKPAPPPVAVKQPRKVEEPEAPPKPTSKKTKKDKKEATLAAKPEPVRAEEMPAQVEEKHGHKALHLALPTEVPPPAASRPTAKLEMLKGITGPAYDPQPLEGEVFERMKMDPQLQAHRRSLILGATMIAGLIIVAIIAHFFKGSEPEPVVIQRSKDEKKVEPSNLTKLPSNAVALRLKGQPSEEVTTPKKLSFELAKDKSTDEAGVNTATTDPASVMKSRPILKPSGTPPKAPAEGLTLAMPGNINTAPSLSKTRPLMMPRVTGTAPEALALTNANKAVASFLHAPSMGARLSMVVNPEAMAPVMREYYTKHVDGPIPFDKITSSRQSELSSRMSEHTVLLKDGSIREVSVIHDNDGTCYVDWPSLVIYSEMDWSEFMSTRSPQSKVFRVYAEKSNHFEGFYNDANGLSCLKLTNPLSPSSPFIYAYADKQSVVGRELDHWMQSSDSQPVKLTIRLKYPLDAENSDQVWLTDILGAGWVTSLPSPGGKNIGQR